MYRRLSVLKDTYVTDRIINGSRRERANLGGASTIDIFKLYGANKSGSIDLVEMSRGLIKFDLDPIRALTGSVIDITDSSFKCELVMRDVYGGQPTPSGYTLVVLPVSRSWDEGLGKDVVLYNDIDSSNFITSSYSDGTVSTWHLSGANKGGLLGSSDLDVILSGNLLDGNGVVSLAVSQTFDRGTEDLVMDVTRIVSATLKGTLPDQGFRLSFTQGQEDDTKTRFVKRFASRHAFDSSMRPRLIVKYNDATLDNQLNSYFDMTNTVFLYNYDRSGPANVLSGSSLTQITGTNSLVMSLITDSPVVHSSSGGLFRLDVTASQHKHGSLWITGVYSASFNILSNHNELLPRMPLSSSIKFTQIWRSLDNTIGYLTHSNYEIHKSQISVSTFAHKNYMMNFTNVRPTYRSDDVARMKLFVTPVDDDTFVASKVPIERTSHVFTNAYYAIRDAFTDTATIPFVTASQATRISSDGSGMYFDLMMSDLDPGHTYEIDVLVKDNGSDQMFRRVSPRFKIV